ncbi:MAG: DUF983 domain-containing protein [Chloroflexota bacterium]
MAAKSLGYSLHKLLLGLFLRCPNCGKGHIFHGLFKMERTCPFCGVRYERRSGESVGGMYINLGAAELLSIGGFFITQALFNPPLVLQTVFWGVFNIVFVLLFYRHARSLWVAISYLTGGVQTDVAYQKNTTDNRTDEPSRKDLRR